MKKVPNSPPKLKLSDLLRRRKMTLRRLLDEFGITTFEGLCTRCTRMGVLPPSETEFKVAFPDPPVNNPPEGVIVLEPPPVIDEITGREIDPDAPVEEPGVIVTTEPWEDHLFGPPQEAPVSPQKKLRRKKEATQAE